MYSSAGMWMGESSKWKTTLTMRTLAPALAKSSVICAPRPLEPPVTTAFRPVRVKVEDMFDELILGQWEMGECRNAAEFVLWMTLGSPFLYQTKDSSHNTVWFRSISSVMHHRGYLTCRNLALVTVQTWHLPYVVFFWLLCPLISKFSPWWLTATTNFAIYIDGMA